MAEQTIEITLPDSVYERIKTTAQANSLSLDEVIQQSVSLLLPTFESDIPPNFRLNLAKLSLLNDIQLWKTANSVMENSHQSRLEKLAEIQKHRTLAEHEQAELDTLMDEAQQVMLCKAEARRLLAQRGYTVFSPASA